MRSSLLLGATVLMHAAALPPPTAAAAELAHPLDPRAPAGALVTENTFDGVVPLLDRDAAAPSFAPEAPDGGTPPLEPSSAAPMDHGAMGHGASGSGTAP